MAATLVQSAQGGVADGDSVAVNFSSTPTVGNVIVVKVAHYGGGAGSVGTSAVTDNQSNTYTRDAHLNHPNDNNGQSAVFRAVANTASGTFTVTCNPTGGPTGHFTRIIIEEWSGLDTADLVETSNTGSANSSTSPATGNLVTATRTMIAGTVSHNSGTTSITTGTNFTQVLETESNADMPIHGEYRIVDAGTYAATWTLGANSQWHCAAVAYNEAAAATTRYIPRTSPITRPGPALAWRE